MLSCLLFLLITSAVHGRPLDEPSENVVDSILEKLRQDVELFEDNSNVRKDEGDILSELIKEGSEAIHVEEGEKLEKVKENDVVDTENMKPAKNGKLSTFFVHQPNSDDPEWPRVLELMEKAKSLPVYNAYEYCRADAIQKMKYISMSCRNGGCVGSDYCKYCYGCMNKQYRSLEGSCNDVDNIFSGVTGFPFERNIPIEMLGYDIPIDEPNVRLISQRLFSRTTFKPHETLNLLGVAYYQFFFHDFLQRGLDPSRELKVDVPIGDPLSGKEDVITVLGTKFHDFGCPFNFSKDMATAWIDGSHIYGSNAEMNTKLRTRMAGKIRLDGQSRLEFDESSVPITGHVGGFWVGLYSLHTLFVREHNAICDMLSEQHPEWRDDQLFNVARLINSAQMLKIFVGSLLPALQPGLEMACIGKWLWCGASKEDLLAHARLDGALGLEPSRLKSVYPPVLGQPEQNVEQPPSTSEDLSAVNRIHALVPETLSVYNHLHYDHSTLSPNGNPRSPPITALNFSFEATVDMKRQFTDEDLLYSMGIERAGAVVLNNYPNSYMRHDEAVPEWSRTMKDIGFDMSVADLLRDRERGTPRYNKFLRSLGKTPPRSFGSLTDNNEAMATVLENVYGGDIEKVDLLVGLIVESQVLNRGLIPHLTLEILIAQLYRKIGSDRFFTKDFNTETYTPEGMYWIRNNDIRTIICRHYDSLCQHMNGLKNPLVTWDDEFAQTEGATTDLV